MPYWTMNSMAVSAADLNVLLNAEGNLDFNLVRPNPAGLDITEGGLKRRAPIKTGEARRCGDVETLARATDDFADLGENHPWSPERYGFPKLGNHIQRLRHARGALRQIRRRELQDGVDRARLRDVR